MLARQLDEYARRDDVLVLALPRGGVPVGFEIARRLGVPLDVFLVRKLGVPWHPELAMGAIASGGVRVLNEDVVGAYGIPSHVVDAVGEREQRELDRRARDYRGDRPFPQLEGRTVILVDDGLATGSTMRAAVRAVRQQQPAAIVVAVPVAAPETCEELRHEADRVVCLRTPQPFFAAFSGQHDGWLISIDRVDADARPRHREGALRGIAIDAANRSAIAVKIDDQETGRRETERVERPRRVTLEQTPGRIDAGLQIETADGRITLRFRHPTPPELVDGVAP